MTSLLSSAAHLERLVPDDVVSAWQTPGERHQRNKVLRRVTYLFAGWAVLTAWALWAIWQHRDDEWAPLGNYPEQVADPVVRVQLDEPATVSVKAVKCADESVLVTGTMAWVSSDPAGRVVAIPTDGAVGRRTEGCMEFTFRNELPAEVVAATVAFGGTASWRLTGVETPINADGAGVPAAWQTNEVLIVVDVPPI